MNISENTAKYFGFWKPSSGFDLKMEYIICNIIYHIRSFKSKPEYGF